MILSFCIGKRLAVYVSFLDYVLNVARGLITELERHDRLEAVSVRIDLRSGLKISESISYLSGIVIS